MRPRLATLFSLAIAALATPAGASAPPVSMSDHGFVRSEAGREAQLRWIHRNSRLALTEYEAYLDAAEANGSPREQRAHRAEASRSVEQVRSAIETYSAVERNGAVLGGAPATPPFRDYTCTIEAVAAALEGDGARLSAFRATCGPSLDGVLSGSGASAAQVLARGWLDAPLSVRVTVVCATCTSTPQIEVNIGPENARQALGEVLSRAGVADVAVDHRTVRFDHPGGSELIHLARSAPAELSLLCLSVEGSRCADARLVRAGSAFLPLPQTRALPGLRVATAPLARATTTTAASALTLGAEAAHRDRWLCGGSAGPWLCAGAVASLALAGVGAVGIADAAISDGRARDQASARAISERTYADTLEADTRQRAAGWVALGSGLGAAALLVTLALVDADAGVALEPGVSSDGVSARLSWTY